MRIFRVHLRFPKEVITSLERRKDNKRDRESVHHPAVQDYCYVQSHCVILCSVVNHSSLFAFSAATGDMISTLSGHLNDSTPEMLYLSKAKILVSGGSDSDDSVLRVWDIEHELLKPIAQEFKRQNSRELSNLESNNIWDEQQLEYVCQSILKACTVTIRGSGEEARRLTEY